MGKEGYKTFVWLAGMIFVDRNFVSRIDEEGLDAVIDDCPLGNDMTDEQEKAFLDAFNQPWLRLLVKLWWLLYDYLRKRGKITRATAEDQPWIP